MFRELQHHVHVVRIGECQFACNLEHVFAIQGHPCCTIGLLQISAGRQRSTAVEYANIVEAQKASLEDVLTRSVFAVDPPSEIEQQFLKATLQPLLVSVSLLHQ